MLPIEDLPYLELPSVVENWVNEARKRFSSAEKSIKIFSGEAHWLLFSHPDIKEVLRRKAKAGVPVSLIAGPILSVWRQGPKLDQLSSGVIELFADKSITIYPRDKRGNYPHFMNIDDSVIYIEDAHDCLAPLVSRTRRKVAKGSKEFDQLIRLFKKHEKKPSENLREDFVLLTPSQIKSLQAKVGRIDDLDKNDIDREMKDL